MTTKRALGLNKKISQLVWQMQGCENIYKCHFQKVETEWFQMSYGVTQFVHDRGRTPTTTFTLQRLQVFFCLVFFFLTPCIIATHAIELLNISVPPTAATSTYVKN